jgi:hypothetical protein
LPSIAVSATFTTCRDSTGNKSSPGPTLTSKPPAAGPTRPEAPQTPAPLD